VPGQRADRSRELKALPKELEGRLDDHHEKLRPVSRPADRLLAPPSTSRCRIGFRVGHTILERHPGSRRPLGLRRPDLDRRTADGSHRQSLAAAYDAPGSMRFSVGSACPRHSTEVIIEPRIERAHSSQRPLGSPTVRLAMAIHSCRVMLPTLTGLRLHASDAPTEGGQEARTPVEQASSRRRCRLPRRSGPRGGHARDALPGIKGRGRHAGENRLTAGACGGSAWYPDGAEYPTEST
jgi:hypothetical protein